jgi:hypothetical protein
VIVIEDGPVTLVLGVAMLIVAVLGLVIKIIELSRRQ